MIEPNEPAIAEPLRDCRLCASAFGFAPRPIVRLSTRAPILIISQAPGARAHKSGVPFDDPSGSRLQDWLGLRPEQFFAPDTLSIAPMGFCFPGHDRAGGDKLPPSICRETWHSNVLAALPATRLTLVIGALAHRAMLGTRAPMTQTVADWRAHAPRLFPLPHPSWRNSAWLKRNPWFEAEVLPALRARVRDVLA